MTTEVILHLTDLHFGYDVDATAITERTLVLKSLVEKVAALPKEWRPTVICITGDVGWRGKQGDYLVAEKWLTGLLERLGLTFSDVIVCPGNHDVDRQITSTLGRPTNADEADQMLRFPIAQHYTDSVAQFSDFCCRNGITEYTLQGSQSHITGQVLHNSIRYVAVNSCWFCKSDDDKGNLWVGLPLLKVMEANNQLPLLPTPDSPPTVVLIHHPPDWWHVAEVHAYSPRPNTRDYLAHRCHIILSGHTHAEVRPTDRIAERALHFTGGSAYAQPGYFNSFRLIRVEPNRVTYRGFEYSPRSPNHQWTEPLEIRNLTFYEPESVATSQSQIVTATTSSSVIKLPSYSRQVILLPHEKRVLLQIVPAAFRTLAYQTDICGLKEIVEAIVSVSRSEFTSSQGNITISLTKGATSSPKLTMQWTDAIGPSAMVASPSVPFLPELACPAARSHLDNIVRLRNEFDFEKAIEAAKELEMWLGKQGEAVPVEERFEAYIVIGEVERLRLAIAKLRGQVTTDTQLATYVERARSLHMPDLSLLLYGRLRNLDAYLTANKQGVEAGLQKLGTEVDPETIRGKLSILIEHEMFSEASDTIRPLQLHERWCDLAVTCLAMNREFASAKHVIDWTEKQPDLSLRKRCILRCAEARYINAFRDRPAGSSVFPGELTQDESMAIQDAIEVLTPITMVVSGNRRVESELESKALQLAIRSHTVICKLDTASKLAQLLMTRIPVPLVLAEFVLGEWVPLPAELPERLRVDHPRSLEATILASMLDGEFNSKAKVEFDSLAKRDTTAISSDEKELLATGLCELAQLCGAEEMSRAKLLAQNLVGNDHKIVFRHKVAELLKNKVYEDARRLLDQHCDENSAVWLQMFAQYNAAMGDHNTALEYYDKASRLAPHPHLLGIVAQLGLKQGRFRASAEALEKRLLVLPDDVDSRRNLAIAYARMHEYDRASCHFGKLREAGASTPDDNLDYAGCLAYSGQQDKALEVLDEMDGLTDPPLAGVINKAHLLKSMDRSLEAFRYLDDRRTLHWGQPEFVATYLDIAYAANEDEKAHLAFQRLLELQQTGHSEHQYLIPGTLEDIKKYAEDYRKRRDTGYREILLGHLPWLFVDAALGHVPYWGWRIRTQDVPWVSEHPLDSVQFTVYSTNGYYVPHDEQSDAGLTELQCPSKGTTVVGDISSLITLHRLGLLHETAAFFGKVYVANEYLEQAAADAERLVAHQLSQKTALQEIQELLNTNKLSIATVGDTSTLPVIDEYCTDESQHHYSLKDIIPVLRQAGRLTDRTASEIATKARRPSGVDSDHAAITTGQKILIALSTLKTIASSGVLKDVSNIFDVCITSQEREEVNSSLRAFAAQDEVRQWHNALWKEIRDDSHFTRVSCHEALSAMMKTKAKDLPRDPSLWAVAYACQHNVVLLADDRTCQMMALNRPDAPHCAAFGSDKTIEALCNAGLISADQEADAMLSLMRWRYRFIVPMVRVLKTIADRYASQPPGNELREIARYVHACLRDPGLFAGPEPTHPPLPLAFRIHQDVIAAVAEFIMAIWAADETKWPDDRVVDLTYWAVTELLPSPPRNMWISGQRLSSFVSDTAFTTALFQSVQIKELRRGNLALRTFADALGLTQDEYTRAVTEVINAI